MTKDAWLKTIGLSLCAASALFPIVFMLWFKWKRSRLRRLVVNPTLRRHWWRMLRGRGYTVQDLSERLGVPEEQLHALDPVYRSVFIPKRSGGSRELNVPSVELKAMQRKILRRILRRLRAHPAATGFERGKSIVENAKAHCGQAVVLKMDIVDFFPQTPKERVTRYFHTVGWDKETAELLARLCTHDGALPQGAPTSPRLSNLVNRELDWALARIATRCRGEYTRYADDITMSFPLDYPRKMRGVVQDVRQAAKAFGYQLHRRKKFQLLRRHHQQRVTGLVVNERVQLPRKTRRWLRAVEHRLETTGACTLTDEQLQGWRALKKMVDSAPN